MSNLTLLLSDGHREYVVRRPPVREVPLGAHDMAREHRALSALQDRLPFVPRVVNVGTDPAAPGGAFLVMERRTGYVVRDTWPETGGGPAVRAALSRSVVRVMCDLHAVDVSSPEVAALGRPNGFFERQVAGWRRRSHASAARDSPAADVVFAWLASAPRPPQGPTVVHNDIKLDNFILAADDLSRIVALLDWELATLSDPLVDLGTLLAYWAEPGDDPDLYGGTLPPVAFLASSAAPSWWAATRRAAAGPSMRCTSTGSSAWCGSPCSASSCCAVTTPDPRTIRASSDSACRCRRCGSTPRRW